MEKREDKWLTQFDVTAETLGLQRGSFCCFYTDSLFPSGDERLGRLGYGHNKCSELFQNTYKLQS